MAQVLPALPVRLIHADANGFLAKCVAQLDGTPLAAGAGVSIDASALTDFDSSVLALLLGVRRAVVSRGGVLEVTGMPSRLRGLATLYGVSELLPA
jgi:phospholipid transport system transporter-binding protein